MNTDTNIVTTQGVTTGSITWPSYYGYWCTGCGVWVAHDTLHTCGSAWYPQPLYIPGGQVSAPQISHFKGPIDSITKLPKNAAVGDAYYVKDNGLLVVRQSNGWFHYDP